MHEGIFMFLIKSRFEKLIFAGRARPSDGAVRPLPGRWAELCRVIQRDVGAALGDQEINVRVMNPFSRRRENHPLRPLYCTLL